MRQITVAPRFQLALISNDFSLLSVSDTNKLAAFIHNNKISLFTSYEISKRSNTVSTVCDISNEYASVLCTINVH